MLSLFSPSARLTLLIHTALDGCLAGVHVDDLGTPLHARETRDVARFMADWEGPSRGCLLGGDVGLGRTIQALVPGSFELIITIRTCFFNGGTRFRSISIKVRILARCLFVC